MYNGVFDIFSRYWRAYGGMSSVLRSPYLHAALVLLGLTFNTWVNPNWWEQSLSVLPNLLGFTLGGFAIFIGFGDEKFRALLAEPEVDHNTPTIYVSLCSTFVHFILVQVLALIYAVVAKSWWFYTPLLDFARPWLAYFNGVAGAIGYGLFLYAVTSVVAATMHVLRIASMYQLHQRLNVTQIAGRTSPTNETQQG
jgi:hypothetical protein